MPNAIMLIPSSVTEAETGLDNINNKNIKNMNFFIKEDPP
jgi:hypothetical protein